MKKLMILGSMLGFVSGIALGSIQGASPLTIFWRAIIAAVISGYLFRWWGRVWLRAWQEALVEKSSTAISADLSKRN